MFLVVAGFFAGGCKSDELKALEAESVADIEVDSADRVEIRTGNGGTALGKPARLYVTQDYVPKDSFTPLQVADDLRDAVIALGWGVETTRPDDDPGTYRFVNETDDANSLQVTIATKTLNPPDDRQSDIEGVYLRLDPA